MIWCFQKPIYKRILICGTADIGKCPLFPNYDPLLIYSAKCNQWIGSRSLLSQYPINFFSTKNFKIILYPIQNNLPVKLFTWKHFLYFVSILVDIFEFQYFRNAPNGSWCTMHTKLSSHATLVAIDECIQAHLG